MTLSIIIINYNVRTFLENALHSIKKATSGIECEIIVVDNASDDGSVEMIREKFPDVRLITNELNIGFARANNIALKIARGKYLALINPDTIIQEDTFASLIKFLENNPEAGLVGCKILNPDGTLQLACRRSIPTPWSAFTKFTGLSSLFPKTKLFGRYNLTYLDEDKIYEVEAISGSFMFLRKAVYEQVGGLDENYFMYGEDLDWCHRIRKSGWKIFYYPETQIIHFKGESTKQSNLNDLKLFYDAMHIFVQKNLNKSAFLHLILHLGILVHSIIALLIRLFKHSILFITDWILILISLAFAFYLRFEKISLPDYAIYPIVIIPGGIITMCIYFLGGYTKYKYSITRTVSGIIFGFLIISSLTYFFKQFAFSRILVVYSAFISITLLVGWRLFIKLLLRYGKLARGGIFGRKTLIIGTSPAAQQLSQKLKTRITDGYDVVGFVDKTRISVGNSLNGIKIIGSIDNINKLIQDYKISDVIFSTDDLSYKEIFNIISKANNLGVHFRMLPSSLEFIIGKTHIDNLINIPLIDIEYRLESKFYQSLKRLIDILGSLVLIFLFFPSKRAFKEKISYNLLTKVLYGQYSLVGLPLNFHYGQNGNYILKPGLTGPIQLDNRNDLTDDEIEKYLMYYSKNYSPLLDIEIIIKWIKAINNR